MDEWMLSILTCPACDARPPVVLQEGRLVCTECGRAYPIRDGLPIMFVEEATLEAAIAPEPPGAGPPAPRE